jgi:PST family polysaccharide transporter
LWPYRRFGGGATARRRPPVTTEDVDVNGLATIVLKNKLTYGAALLAGAQLGKRLLDLAAMVVLARLLAPSDFGLIALAASVTAIAMAMADLPLSDITLRQTVVTDEHYASIMVLSLARGVAITLIIWAISYPMALAYADPRLVPILCVLAMAPLSRSMVSPRMAEYSRKLSFKQESMLEVGSRLIAIVVSIAWAMHAPNHWAIVINQVTSPALYTIGSYVIAPTRLRFSLKYLRDIFAFSAWLALQRTMNTINFYVDRLLIVPQLGMRQLGLYTVGGDWAALPTQAAQAPMSRVLYAGMARLHNEPERLKGAYLASMEASATMLFPIGIGTSLVAHRLVPIALGEKWLGAALIIAVLAPIFSLQSVTAPAQALAMSKGQTRQLFTRDVINFVFRVPLVIGGLMIFGLWGLMTARLIAGLNIVGMNFVLAKRLCGATIIQQARSMTLAIVGSVAMIAGVVGVDHLLDAYPNAVVLVCDVVVGGICYGAVVLTTWLILGKPRSIVAVALNFTSRIWTYSQERRDASRV